MSDNTLIKEITNADSDVAQKILSALRQQNDLYSALLQKVGSTPSTEGNEEKKIKSSRFNFTKKEIKLMPRLKDFHIRIKNDKYYEIRYRKHGYNVSFSSTDFEKAKQKAFAWLSAFEHEIYAGYKFTVLSKTEDDDFFFNKQMPFKTFADNYLNTIKKKSVKENTFKDLINKYKNNIEPIYGKMPICKIRPYFIQSHMDKLHDKTPRLCETVKGLLNNIFGYAVDNGILKINPMKSVFVQKHERQVGQALTYEEEKRFIEAIKGNRHEFVYLKMLYSGVRPCEINFVAEDKENNVISVKNGKLKSYQKEKYRIIPIFPLYKPYADIKCERVNTEKLSNEFRTLCPNHALKDLRHTFTSRARECGIDNELVAVWTGHSLGNITSRVYTHFSDAFQQREAKKLTYKV